MTRVVRTRLRVRIWILAGLPAIVSLGAVQAAERVVKYQPRPWAPNVWPSQPPKDVPFPNSKEIAGIAFTGAHSDYHVADTWYPTWASDGNMYSPWTDGSVEGVSSGSGGPNATTGQAVMIGDNPLNLKLKNLGLTKGSPSPYGGRYPCGSLVYNGEWYYSTYCLGPKGRTEHEGIVYNWPWLGPVVGFRTSTDFGKRWTETPHTPEKPLFGESGLNGHPVKIGAPHFVDFGKNMEHSPDGKAYLVGHGAVEPDPKPRFANLSWISGDQVYLIRVTPSIENINDMSKYEFFAGHDDRGEPVWSKDFSKIEPLIDWNNNCGCVTITYNSPLRKYLMCITDGWPTASKMSTYILESDKITGPWKLVTYMKEFGEQGYFVNFPSKFISEDGRTAWLCYSANFARGWNNVEVRENPPGSHYGLVLQEVKLLDEETYKDYEKRRKEQQKDPIKSDRNIARKAKVTVTSSYKNEGDKNFYRAEAAIDGVVGGYPDDMSAEWASQGEKNTAMLRLTWDQPQTINRVWLFDRPNTDYDQVTAGMLVFSDGTTISVGELPDDASAAREVSFPPKKVSWLLFVVTSVSQKTLNVGLAEIAVFSPDDGK